jgi:hypothetical protein
LGPELLALKKPGFSRLKPNVTYFTTEMRFGLFELQFAHGWLWAKKSSITELPLNSDVEYWTHSRGSFGGRLSAGSSLRAYAF